MSALRIDVADLLTHPGARRPVHVEVALDDLGTPVARIVEPVRLALVLERVPDGIVARGELHAVWDGECSTCLRDVSANITVGVAELYEPHPLDGDTYPIDGHELDLEQLVRDALVLELPLAPACERDDCAPVEGGRVLVGADDRADDEHPGDPRWAALSELDL
jgi:uncharacterized protein